MMAPVVEEIVQYEPGQLSICSPPDESRENIASVVFDAETGKSLAFQIIKFTLVPLKLRFPRLLSGATELEMSRQELRNELMLVIQRPEFYSVQILEPMPIKVSRKVAKLIEDYSVSVGVNFKVGYLLHSDLHKVNQWEQLSRLVEAFLDASTVVETKLQDARRVRVKIG